MNETRDRAIRRMRLDYTWVDEWPFSSVWHNSEGIGAIGFDIWDWTGILDLRDKPWDFTLS